MPTMEKDDVIYGEEEKVKPSTVDWNKILTLTKPVPPENLTAAKAVCKDAAENPEMAGADVNLVMIGDDLYLRLKLRAGRFKENIREDTLIAKGYRKLKAAPEAEKKAVETKEKEAAAKREGSSKLPVETLSQDEEKPDGERVRAEFELMFRNEVVSKFEKVVERIKLCGDLLNGQSINRDSALKIKMTYAGLPPLIHGLEMGLTQIDELIHRNPVILDPRKAEVGKYRKVSDFRDQAKEYDVQLKQLIKDLRAAAVVSDEYREQRDGVIRDFEKAIDDIKALQPRAAARLAPAQAATDLFAIKQEHEEIEALRAEAIKVSAPTRLGGVVSDAAKKIFSKEDIVDYIFDLSTEAKEASHEVSKELKAALAALEVKLKELTTTPETATLLQIVQMEQLSNK